MGYQKEAAHLAAMAAQLIQAGTFPPAAWRLADAGALLRLALDETGDTARLCGFNEPTGRGAMLPTAA